MSGPTMEDLRIAGIEAHLEPIRQELDEVMAVIHRRLLALGIAATVAVVVAYRAARATEGTP